MAYRNTNHAYINSEGTRDDFDSRVRSGRKKTEEEEATPHTRVTKLSTALEAEKAALEEKKSVYIKATEERKQQEKRVRMYQSFLEEDAAAYRATSDPGILERMNKTRARLGTVETAYTNAAEKNKKAITEYNTEVERYNHVFSDFQVAYKTWSGGIRPTEDVEAEIGNVDRLIQRRTEERRRRAERVNNSKKAGQEWENAERRAGRDLGNYKMGEETAADAALVAMYDKEIAELQARKGALETELYYSTIVPYTEKEDFEEESEYETTATREELEWTVVGPHMPKGDIWNGDWGFRDIKYDFINGDTEARRLLRIYEKNTDMKGAGLSLDFLESMTDEEVAVYNYIYATEGKEASEKYLNRLENGLQARHLSQNIKKWEDFGTENKIEASIASVLLAGEVAIAGLMNTITYVAGGHVDEYAGYNEAVHISQALRRGVTKEWGKAGTFAYNVGMSMADFAASLAMAGGNPVGAQLIMSSRAMADTAVSAKMRGLSDNQAFTLGAVAAAAEALTERYSLDALLKGGKQGWQYIAKNALTEASEETASSAINFMADVFVAKDQSEWAEAVEAYEAEGYSESEAFGKAFGDQMLAMGLDALGGAISGGGLSGSVSLANSAINSRANRAEQKASVLAQRLDQEAEREKRVKMEPVSMEATAPGTAPMAAAAPDTAPRTDVPGVPPAAVTDTPGTTPMAVSVPGTAPAAAMQGTVLPTAETAGQGIMLPTAKDMARTAGTEYGGMAEADHDARMDVLEAEASMAGQSMLYEDGRQFSIVGTTADGIEVYETSDKIKSLPYKERIKEFKRLMEEEYRGRTAKFTKNGKVFYARFANEDINKNIYGDKVSDQSGRNAKINVGADGNIFELVENASFDRSQREAGKPGKAHKAVNSWSYFVKTVQIDNAVYDLVANVREATDGEYVYFVRLNENKSKTPAPSLAPAYNRQGRNGYAENRMLTSASDNSIPQTASLSQENIAKNPFAGTLLPTAEQQRIQAERQARAAKAETETERTGILLGVPDKIIREAKNVAKALGADVRFYRRKRGGRVKKDLGYYDHNTGIIYLNADIRNPASVILGHEMIHHIQLTKGYLKFADTVLKKIQQDGGNLNEKRQELKERYAENGVELTSLAKIDQEVIAEYAQAHLFTDEASITSVVNADKESGSVIRRFLDNVLAKLGNTNARERVFVARARSLYAKALRENESVQEQSRWKDTVREEREKIRAASPAEATPEGRGGENPSTADAVPLPLGKGGNEGEQDAAEYDDMTEEEYNEKMDILDAEASMAGESMLYEDGRQYSIEKEKGVANRGGVEYNKYNMPTRPLKAGDTFPPSGGASRSEANQLATMWAHREDVDEGRQKIVSYHNGVYLIEKDSNTWMRYRIVKKLTQKEYARIKKYYEEDGEYGENSGRQQGRERAIPNSEKDRKLNNDRERRNRDSAVSDRYNRKDGSARAMADDKNGGGGIENGRIGTDEYGVENQQDVGYSQPDDVQYAIAKDGTEKAAAENLPSKAATALRQTESRLSERIGEILGVPKQAQRDFLQGIIRDISDDYLQSGRVDREKADALFEEAYRQGVVVDTAYYEKYKHIRDHLRGTQLTISEEDRSSIADFGAFRKSAFGKLRIVNEGGLPVDVAYAELVEMAPELFPEDITHPADQLQQMFEIADGIRKTEQTLDEAYGDDAETFKAAARDEFHTEINSAAVDFKRVKRYSDDRSRIAEAQEAEKKESIQSREELDEAYKNLKTARRNMEKVKRRALLTEQDEMRVGQLLRGEISPMMLDVETDNVKDILAVYRAKQEYETYAKRIRDWNRRRREGLAAQAQEYLANIQKWKDKVHLGGFRYSRETMERNFKDIMGEDADALIAEYLTPVHKAQAAATRLKNEMREKVRKLNLSRKVAAGNTVSEAHAVQLLGEAEDNIAVLKVMPEGTKRDGKTRKEWEGTVAKLWAENPNLDEEKIREAVKTFRDIYDDLFAQMNEARVRNGYEPVNYRRGYFPHFQPGDEGVLAQFGRALGIDTAVSALPTTINGMTHIFKPGIRWLGNVQERLGFNTVYDAVEGFDKYIEGVADVIHQTDNIQKLRALAKEIRYAASDEGIKKQVDQIEANPALSRDEKDALISQLYENAKFTLGNFVVELDEYTNLLANKKSRADREMERKLGRNMYNIMQRVNGNVAGNMVALNIPSWLTNFIPLTQAWGLVDTKYLLRGMGDTIKAYKSGDDIVSRSTFLTNRRGTDPLVQIWEQGEDAKNILGKMWRGYQAGVKKLSGGMEFIDAFTSDSIVRAKYYQNLDAGMSEAAAMDDADAFAAGVMADRSKGAMPTTFYETNPIKKLFTQFQLEVNNQYSYMFKDMPRAIRERGMAALAIALTKLFLGAWIFNELYELIFGRRAAFDPVGIINDAVGDFSGKQLDVAGGITGRGFIDEKEDPGAWKGVSNLVANVGGELPFVGGVVFDGGRVPMSSAMPDVQNVGKAIFSGDWSGKKRAATLGKEFAKPFFYTMLPGGGGQIKKIVEGTDAIVRGGSYTTDAQGNDILQYPVYNDNVGQVVLNGGRAILFGKSTLPTAADWVDGGFKSLSAKDTETYQAMLAAGVGGEEAFTAVQAVRKADSSNDKRDAIRISGLSDEGKKILYRGKISDTRDDDIAALEAAGLNFDEFLRAHNEYTTINNQYEGQGATQNKATAFSRWVNSQPWTKEQKDQVRDTFMYFNQMPAEAVRYDKLVDAGLTDEKAANLATAIDRLEPEAGKDQVSDLQRYRAVATAGLSDKEKMAALSTMMSESEYAKLEVGQGQGVTPIMYVTFREKLLAHDADGNGTFKQEEVTAAIRAMSGTGYNLPKHDGSSFNLTNKQRAALWQMANKSWKPKNNPFDTSVGTQVYNALKAE